MISAMLNLSVESPAVDDSPEADSSSISIIPVSAPPEGSPPCGGAGGFGGTGITLETSKKVNTTSSTAVRIYSRFKIGS